MSDEEVEVSAWTHIGDGNWITVGGATYERLEMEIRHQDVGTWSMTLPDGHQSDAITPGRLVTTRFRDDLRTWVLDPRTATLSEEGETTVTLAGVDALSYLGHEIAWPNPTLPLADQLAEGNYTGPAETVIRTLVTQNLSGRYGLDFDAPASQGRGTTVTSKPRYVNLLEEVLTLAKAGGIGVRFGLATTSSDTRARLQLSFHVPRDRTTRVHLSADEGSLESWELIETAPTATRAIVGGFGEGAGQYLREVATPEGDAAAAEWGGHRVVFVDGPDTFDNTVLDQTGREAITAGLPTTSLTMAAQEPAGTRAFVAFTLGDQVTALPAPDLEIPDVVSAIRIIHEADSGVEVTPIFGSPDEGDPDAVTAEIIRNLRRELQALKINRKRGEV